MDEKREDPREFVLLVPSSLRRAEGFKKSKDLEIRWWNLGSLMIDRRGTESIILSNSLRFFDPLTGGTFIPRERLRLEVDRPLTRNGLSSDADGVVMNLSVERCPYNKSVLCNSKEFFIRPDRLKTSKKPYTEFNEFIRTNRLDESEVRSPKDALSIFRKYFDPLLKRYHSWP